MIASRCALSDVCSAVSGCPSVISQLRLDELAAILERPDPHPHAMRLLVESWAGPSRVLVHDEVVNILEIEDARPDPERKPIFLLLPVVVALVHRQLVRQRSDSLGGIRGRPIPHGVVNQGLDAGLWMPRNSAMNSPKKLRRVKNLDAR